MEHTHGRVNFDADGGNVPTFTPAAPGHLPQGVPYPPNPGAPMNTPNAAGQPASPTTPAGSPSKPQHFSPVSYTHLRAHET